MSLILLDDALSSNAQPSSRLYGAPVRSWRVETPEGVALTLSEIEDALASGLYVVAAFSYEFGEWLQGLEPRASSTPWLSAQAFQKVSCLSKKEVDDFIDCELQKHGPDCAAAGVFDIGISASEETFQQDIEKIKEEIRKGNTYQVNHTIRISGKSFGHALALYARLRQRQPSRFGAFLDFGDRQILSVSPEWFVECKDGVLTSKPMKGTAPADTDPQEALTQNTKNRAENLMIVDLIRNDLGRISEIGSVSVPALFETEQFGEVLQMTSTVRGRKKSGVGLQKLLEAMFPCGSVTGAPKCNTMKIIQGLEASPRGIYCGAIGWFDPPKNTDEKLGDFSLSVAIRTLSIDLEKHFELGVGAGITIDSDGKEEWAETLLKAKFVTALPASVGLIETIRIENGRAPFLEKHLLRLGKSCGSLNIWLNQDNLLQAIHKKLSELSRSPQTQRLRISVRPDGQSELTISPVKEVTGTQKIFWARDLIGEKDSVMKSSDPLLAHKTTARHRYDSAWKKAEELGGFDALFTNEKSEVTEGGRSSLFIKSKGRWLTPALSCGVLPGVMREILLTDPSLNAEEAIIREDDVLSAQEILMVNALRGKVSAALSKP